MSSYCQKLFCHHRELECMEDFRPRLTRVGIKILVQSRTFNQGQLSPFRHVRVMNPCQCANLAFTLSLHFSLVNFECRSVNPQLANFIACSRPRLKQAAAVLKMSDVKASAMNTTQLVTTTSFGMLAAQGSALGQ